MQSSYNFEKRFDIVPLPSGGLFYENKCDKVKLLDLTNEDDSILTAPNLIASGEMVDVLLRKKVQPVEGYDHFVSPDNMVIGDRLALVIVLRAKMENIYNIQLPDGTYYPFDLNTLQMKKIEEMDVLPDDKGLYTFRLPKSEVDVQFKMMTGLDEKMIRSEQMKNNSQYNEYKSMKLQNVVMSVDGNTDRIYIRNFLRQMPIMDGRALGKFMNDVVPTFDLNIKVQSPGGGTFDTFLRLDSEFWFPGD